MDQNQPIVRITSTGDVVFTPPLTFTSTGTYTYTVRETTASGDGWTTDSRIYTVVVTVTDDGQGHLVYSLAYPDGTPYFVNNYTASPVDVNLRATKTANGAALTAGAFSFGVYDENNVLLGTATNDANGDVNFGSITFPETGNHTYTVREITPSGNGWTTDGTSYPVNISITDDGLGHLVSSVTYPNGQPEFNNVYTTAPSTADVSAHKVIVGWNGMTPVFEFELENLATGQVTTATNDADGLISFPSMTYTQPGTYQYIAREKTTSGNGWTTDTTTYPVTVTVTDNGMGQLVTQVTYPNGSPTFNNTYTPAPVDVELVAQKTANGAALPEGRFSFSVYDQSGNVVATATNGPGTTTTGATTPVTRAAVPATGPIAPPVAAPVTRTTPPTPGPTTRSTPGSTPKRK